MFSCTYPCFHGWTFGRFAFVRCHSKWIYLCWVHFWIGCSDYWNIEWHLLIYRGHQSFWRSLPIQYWEHGHYLLWSPGQLAQFICWCRHQHNKVVDWLKDSSKPDVCRPKLHGGRTGALLGRWRLLNLDHSKRDQFHFWNAINARSDLNGQLVPAREYFFRANAAIWKRNKLIMVLGAWKPRQECKHTYLRWACLWFPRDWPTSISVEWASVSFVQKWIYQPDHKWTGTELPNRPHQFKQV